VLLRLSSFLAYTQTIQHSECDESMPLLQLRRDLLAAWGVGVKNRMRLPDGKEFYKFWRPRKTRVPCLFIAVCLYLTLFAGLALLAAPRMGLAALGLALAFLGMPVIALWLYLKANQRFLRCPSCRRWIGLDSQDQTGMWRKGTEPAWVTVHRTGVCPYCGNRMLAAKDRVAG
jgi:hypothetical protein